MPHGRAGLPSFLIIGSAKSGTTTLFSDLGAHGGIFFPVVKEPCDLVRDDVLTPRGLATYRKIFRDARPGQLLGEASTLYTARPLYEGVAERAYRVLGPELKLIYVVRDPIERVLSEHRYMARLGKLSANINVAIRERRRMIVERSRYAYQIETWLERFPRENLRLIVFEQYVHERAATVRALFDFLGVGTPPGYVLPGAKNSSDEVVVPRGVLGAVVRTELYRRTVRRLFSGPTRERAKRWFGRKLPVELEQRLTAELERELLDRLRPEVDALHRLAGWDRPMWQRFA